MLSILTLIEQW